jgi:pyruvoyl-dependent arginine decarboxylase
LDAAARLHNAIDDRFCSEILVTWNHSCYTEPMIPKRCFLKKGGGICPGEIVFCVYDRESTNEPNRLVVASVGVAIPADQEQYGYLSEHHEFGETEETAGDYAEDLAASMLATTLGIEFNPDTAWDERENLFKMSGKIVLHVEHHSIRYRRTTTGFGPPCSQPAPLSTATTESILRVRVNEDMKADKCGLTRRAGSVDRRTLFMATLSPKKRQMAATVPEPCAA